MPRLAERKLKVLVVDDHPMVREGLASMLEGEVGALAEAGTGKDALARVDDFRPDLVLLDIRLPDVDGLSVLQRMKVLAPTTCVVIVTMHDDPEYVRKAVTLGAAGYVLKGITRRELLATVRAATEGESVLAPAVLQRLLEGVTPDPGSGGSRTGTDPPLSRAEREVLTLLARGLTNKEIALRLRSSVGSVKKHIQRILKTLQVSDRTHAAVEAVRRGLVE